MEKVKVSKRVATAIEHYKENGWSFEMFMTRKLGRGFESCVKGVVFNDINNEDFASILINGYEVEETLQEKWANIVKNLEIAKTSEDYRVSGYAAEILINIRKMNQDFKLDIPGA